jgi:hypothetical protein
MTHTKKIQGRRASFRPASLTVGDLDLRTDMGLDASTATADSPLPALLDKVIFTMLTQHCGDPTRALTITSKVLQGSKWKNYRSGRSRIATMAASYLRWLAPPEPRWFRCSENLQNDRLGLRWSGPEGEFVDIIECDSRADRRAAAAAAHLVDVVGVRLLRLEAPRHSIFFTADDSPVRIAETPWLFNEVAS